MRVVSFLFMASFAANQQHSVVTAFAPFPARTSHSRFASTTLSSGASSNNNDSSTLLDVFVKTQKHATKAVAAAFLAGALWAAPAAVPPSISQGGDVPVMMVAQAKEMASGSGSRVNKDPESLLRYGLPINNKEVSAEIHGT